MTSLSKISTFELAAELAKRSDLRDATVRLDGLVHDEHWRLRTLLGAIPCVDGIAVRFEPKDCANWRVWGGVIRRNNGLYFDKLCLVGGTVALNESVEDALRRHWRTDVGLEIRIPFGWQYPICMNQYKPEEDPEGIFSHDPTKHSVATVHIVTVNEWPAIRFGAKFGGQEARGFEWHTAESCPPESEWGYGMRATFLRALTRADSLRPLISRS